MAAAWKLDHDPDARPLGCNGSYGKSGYTRHKKAGEEACEECCESAAHYMREWRRGGFRKRKLQPCGTTAAAQRHWAAGEPLCWDCRLANAAKSQALRDSLRSE